MEIRRDKRKRVISLTAYGHAGYDIMGEDIHCAAVSVLLQTLVLGLEEYVKISPIVEIEEGFLRCELPEKMSPEQSQQTETLVAVSLLGLSQIEKKYPAYLKLIDL